MAEQTQVRTRHRKDEQFDIRVCDPSDHELRQQIFRLRYRVSVEEMGKRPAAADHQRRLITDALDDARSTLLVALVDGEPVATLRLSWGTDHLPARYRSNFGLEDFSCFPSEATSLTSRLVVAEPWRGTSVLGLLLNGAFRLVRERSARLSFCSCAPSLVRLYEQLGFRRYRNGYVDDDLGYQVPLVLLTEDAEHLRHIRSPFYRVARRYQNTEETAKWYARHFPDYAAAPVWGARESADVVGMLARRLFETDIPLFRGLSSAATETFVQASTVLDCRAGDHLVRQGDVGAEMYLVLEGAAEVVRELKGRRYPLTSLGPGQIFGEMAFLSSRQRSASVIAATDLKVLVLTQRSLKRMMQIMPETAMHVLFNLAITLCDRLDASTEHWLLSLSGQTAKTANPENH